MVATFRGSYSVTVTPFTADRRAIDLDALRQFMEWQVTSGVPGVIVLGSTGEFLTVSDEERALIIETTVKQVAGRAHVLAGTMNTHTPNAVRYSKQAEDLGADGLTSGAMQSPFLNHFAGNIRGWNGPWKSSWSSCCSQR